MKETVLLCVLAAMVLGIVALSRGWADGIAEAPLHYSGVLEEDGAPVKGTRNLEIELWDDPDDADENHRVCATRRDEVAIVDGRFRVALDAGCTTAVQQNPDLWVEIRVDHESLGRTKIGAAPYAAESARASQASGALRAELDTMAPPGAIIAFGGQRPPDGWLLCDGAEVSRADYPALFAALGTAHGAGDGATTFRLPDYRGRFLRGVDAGAARDPEASARAAASAGGNTGDAIGSVQTSATALPRNPFVTQNAGQHTHTFPYGGGTANSNSISYAETQPWTRETSASGDHSHTLTGGDAQTRPENAGVNFIIRY